MKTLSQGCTSSSTRVSIATRCFCFFCGVFWWRIGRKVVGVDRFEFLNVQKRSATQAGRWSLGIVSIVICD